MVIKKVSQSAEVRLLQGLLESEMRVFDIMDLQSLAQTLGIKQYYISKVLAKMTRDGWLKKIKKGIFALESIVGVSPVYEFEIAMCIVKPAMISHYSAFRHHGLTDQLPKDIFTTTIKEKSTSRARGQQKRAGFKLDNVIYRIIQVKKEKFFGAEKIQLKGGGEYLITDLERTLLDGFSKPQYCGGFSEVMHGLEERMNQVDLEKIVDYALKMDIATSRRLGWALEQLGISDKRIVPLSQIEKPGYRNLDPTKESKGKYLKKWKLRINI